MFQASREIRACLRTASRLIVDSGRSMSVASTKYRLAKQAPLQLELRFLRQGSLAYGTEIDPAQKPPQQSDLDDGVYARTSFLSDLEPGLASVKYFELVENALESLCAKRGWTLVKTKSTCVRVIISSHIHIDLPLYAVPDAEFVFLEKSIADATRGTSGKARLGAVLDRFKDIRIPTDRVMLAHRERGWIQSDPRALHDWFLRECDRYGPQLKRASRYLKGWRDFTFLSGGPASIALMVCVSTAFGEGGWEPLDDRDDLALLEVSRRLPEYFQSRIANPVLADGAPLNDWDELERKRYIAVANDFHRHVQTALEGTMNAEVTVRKLRQALGERVPFRPDLVKVLDSAPARAPAIITSVSPLPLRRPTTSG